MTSHPLHQGSTSNIMTSLPFLLLLALALVLGFLKRSRASAQKGEKASRFSSPTLKAEKGMLSKEGSVAKTSRSTRTEQDFIPRPQPSPTLTPENLHLHSARDHIYANKAIRYPYHQTMAHQPMLPENWIEPDLHYRYDLEFKRKVIHDQGKVVLDIVEQDDVRLGCQELMLRLSDWLSQRYPNLFQLTPLEKEVEGEESLGEGIWNKVTDERLCFYLDDQVEDDHEGGAQGGKATSGGKRRRLKDGVEALKVVSRLVQDDFLIASPKGDGSWICAGGLVAFPGFYLLSEKINTSLFQTHAPVPQFNEKILKSVERTLTRLEPSKPIERTSWELVDDEFDLFWVPMAGPLPTSSGARRTTPKHHTGRDRDATKFEDPSQLILRLDHQTFVKMPKSGIVFFGVHPMRRKLEELENSPLLPALLVKVHEEAPKDLMDYKAAPLYSESVLPYLRELHRRQIERGLIKGDERVQDFRSYAKDVPGFVATPLPSPSSTTA
ncbi:hypothetical protein IE53DRAFT_111082 [Violaceomyces palustris]|uniref:Uncharacterized protein n=1 Tax=Violaceomyces palustris TaxID=1673888 RepID=A0ACD0NW91_9BASI|nr:hypothetical protein IE53DRAFT_111082 [Violaceomyces palustris]